MKERFAAVFALALFGWASTSKAQEGVQYVNNISVGAIERAIQCEIGNFAKYISKQKVAPARLKAAYSLSEKVSGNGGSGMDLGIFSWINFGASQSQGWGSEGDVTFDPINIHPKNAKACSRRQDALRLLDLRACLQRYAEVYDHANIKCGSQINVKRSFTGGVKFPIYVVTLGPQASWGTEYSQGVKVIAPSAKE
ncbi:hypothetical protein [Bradyrhizobium pachyrhizi]|uniref:hypothetical protein n=1 Tax=Bradyrhizobium pachyrhizi TaxID=280333 RepID=UPI00067BB9AE|nr:hypothetical protein [Bradyrhizobium pachyrhizi]